MEFEEYIELVNRNLREHTGYTGDGFNNNGELPIGDRSTATWHVDKIHLRELFIAGVTPIQAATEIAKQAAEDAEAASELAEEAAQAALDAVAGVQGATFWAANVDALKANTEASYPPGTIFGTREEGYGYEVVADGGDITTAGGVQLNYARGRYVVELAAFDPTLDGEEDNTAELTKALSAVSQGGMLIFPKNATVRTTEPMIIPSGVIVDLNGSTLDFYSAGAKRNLSVMGDNVTIRNGRVRNMKGDTGQEGTYQTPIVIGQYTVLEGYKNILIENVEVETALPGGNGISVLGDTSNVVIRNIHFPDSPNLGIAILAHWSFNGNWQTVPPKTTSHQRNLIIENITTGNLTYTTGTDGPLSISVIFLSAAYNAIVRNVEIESCPNGKAVTVYAGDWGFQYDDDADVRNLSSRGIIIENIRGRVHTGLDCYMQNPLDPPMRRWPVSINCRQMNVIGSGTGSKQSQGIKLNAAHNVTVENSSFDGFFVGCSIQANVVDLTFRNNNVINSVFRGIDSSAASNGTRWKIENNRFQNNNTGNTANNADIFLRNNNTSHVIGNVMSSPNCDWGLRCENTTSGIIVNQNIVSAAKVANYSFGSVNDYNVVREFSGNTASGTAAAGFREGQIYIAESSSLKRGTGLAIEQRTVRAIAPPIGGGWNSGDIIFNDSPSAGGTVGWVCVGSGNPGIWRTFGVISAT